MKRMAFNHRIPQTLFGIRLPLKIVERFYGKEYSVHATQKCIKKELMYSFVVHFLTGRKISHKIHARVLPFC